MKRGITLGTKEVLGESGTRSLLPFPSGPKLRDLPGNAVWYEVDASSLRNIPYETAMKNKIVPLYMAEGSLAIAMVNPSDPLVLDDLKFMTGLNPIPVTLPEKAILQAIKEIYGRAETQPGLDSGESGGCFGCRRCRTARLTKAQVRSLYFDDHTTFLCPECYSYISEALRGSLPVQSVGGRGLARETSTAEDGCDGCGRRGLSKGERRYTRFGDRDTFLCPTCYVSASKTLAVLLNIQQPPDRSPGGGTPGA